MPRIIVKAGYFKNGKNNPHGEKYLEYIATRQGVDILDSSSLAKPATASQKKFIKKILLLCSDAKQLDEYLDYMNGMTRGNASEFISSAIENFSETIYNDKTYLDYIATRPRAERRGSHGLFSDLDTQLNLGEESRKLKNHRGCIWTLIVSLSREDAERLNFNSAERWQTFFESQKDVFAENLKIPESQLHWFGAFHNEAHHPHCHLVFYADDPRIGYLSKQGIDKIRAKLANGIFEQDLECIYAEQSKRRDELTAEARNEIAELVAQLQRGMKPNPKIAEKLIRLSELLETVQGKKQYGYLPPRIRQLVDEITDELAKDEQIKRLYDLWYEKRYDVLKTYSDAMPEKIPLSQQKEFKPIRNAVIYGAVKLSKIKQSNEIKNKYALNCTVRLLAGLTNIFRDSNELREYINVQHTDSKLLREIEEKKNAQSYGDY